LLSVLTVETVLGLILVGLSRFDTTIFLETLGKDYPLAHQHIAGEGKP